MNSAYFYYIFSLILFGSNGVIASYISLTSSEIVLYRTFIGSAFLFSIFIFTKKRWTFYKYKKSFFYLVLSGFSMGAGWIFLYEAYQQIGVSISSLLYYCGPILVMALSPILFKEKFYLRKLLGFLCVFAGVLFLNGTLFLERYPFWGIICGLMSAVMYAFMIIFNKKAVNINGLENSLLQLTFSFIIVAFITILQGNYTFDIPQASVIPLLFLGTINTGFGCYLYFSKLDKIPVQSVSILGYLEPLSAVLLSVILLKETMRFTQIIGTCFILGGSIYAELSGRLELWDYKIRK